MTEFNQKEINNWIDTYQEYVPETIGKESLAYKKANVYFIGDMFRTYPTREQVFYLAFEIVSDNNFENENLPLFHPIVRLFEELFPAFERLLNKFITFKYKIYPGEFGEEIKELNPFLCGIEGQEQYGEYHFPFAAYVLFFDRANLHPPFFRGVWNEFRNDVLGIIREHKRNIAKSNAETTPTDSDTENVNQLAELQAEKAKLEKEYNQLAQEKAKLEKEYNQLAQEKAKLEKEYNQLARKKEALENEVGRLRKLEQALDWQKPIHPGIVLDVVQSVPQLYAAFEALRQAVYDEHKERDLVELAKEKYQEIGNGTEWATGNGGELAVRQLDSFESLLFPRGNSGSGNRKSELAREMMEPIEQKWKDFY